MEWPSLGRHPEGAGQRFHQLDARLLLGIDCMGMQLHLPMVARPDLHRDVDERRPGHPHLPAVAIHRGVEVIDDDADMVEVCLIKHCGASPVVFKGESRQIAVTASSRWTKVQAAGWPQDHRQLPPQAGKRRGLCKFMLDQHNYAHHDPGLSPVCLLTPPGSPTRKPGAVSADRNGPGPCG